jgi:hypothetical protein
MAKEKTEKYYEAPEVEEKVREITKNYPTLCPVSIEEFKFIFKDMKYKPSKKQISIKILKEPITLVSNKKALFIVGAEWFATIDESDKTKAFIESLVGLTTDDEGKLEKRDFDVQTYSDLVKDPRYDWAKFKKVLPLEIEDLKLKSDE